MPRSNTEGLPLAVLVSGAPASGKTTLAGELASRLGIFHLNRDGIWSGLRFTVNRGGLPSIASRGIVAEYGTMEHLLGLGVSLLADGCMYAGEFEAHVRRIQDLATVVNVHCRAKDPIARDQARQKALGWSPEELATRRERIEAIHERVVDPLDLGCRVIEVATDDGYDPAIEQLVQMILEVDDAQPG